MTLTIELSREDGESLRARAAAVQQDVKTYARETLINSLLAIQSLADAMLPLQQAFGQSGLSESEIDDLIDRAKHEYRREQR